MRWRLQRINGSPEEGRNVDELLRMLSDLSKDEIGSRVMSSSEYYSLRTRFLMLLRTIVSHNSTYVVAAMSVIVAAWAFLWQVSAFLIYMALGDYSEYTRSIEFIRENASGASLAAAIVIFAVFAIVSLTRTEGLRVFQHRKGLLDSPDEPKDQSNCSRCPWFYLNFAIAVVLLAWCVVTQIHYWDKGFGVWASHVFPLVIAAVSASFHSWSLCGKGEPHSKSVKSIRITAVLVALIPVFVVLLFCLILGLWSFLCPDTLPKCLDNNTYNICVLPMVPLLLYAYVWALVLGVYELAELWEFFKRAEPNAKKSGKGITRTYASWVKGDVVFFLLKIILQALFIVLLFCLLMLFVVVLGK